MWGCVIVSNVQKMSITFQIKLQMVRDEIYWKNSPCWVRPVQGSLWNYWHPPPHPERKRKTFSLFPPVQSSLFILQWAEFFISSIVQNAKGIVINSEWPSYQLFFLSVRLALFCASLYQYLHNPLFLFNDFILSKYFIEYFFLCISSRCSRRKNDGSQREHRHDEEEKRKKWQLNGRKTKKTTTKFSVWFESTTFSSSHHTDPPGPTPESASWSESSYAPFRPDPGSVGPRHSTPGQTGSLRCYRYPDPRSYHFGHRPKSAAICRCRCCSVDFATRNCHCLDFVDRKTIADRPADWIAHCYRRYWTPVSPGRYRCHCHQGWTCRL